MIQLVRDLGVHAIYHLHHIHPVVQPTADIDLRERVQNRVDNIKAANTDTITVITIIVTITIINIVTTMPWKGTTNMGATTKNIHTKVTGKNLAVMNERM
jgi:hypothetical protein